MNNTLMRVCIRPALSLHLSMFSFCFLVSSAFLFKDQMEFPKKIKRPHYIKIRFFFPFILDLCNNFYSYLLHFYNLEKAGQYSVMKDQNR